MTLGQSQWVGADDDLVLGPADARVAGAGLWATNSADSHDVRYGLVWNGGANLLTGTSGPTVNVAPHHFLATKGATNGPYLGANKTSTAVTVPAAPSLGSKRIDVIWVRQKDKSALALPDASTAAEYGVATGVASSSPDKIARGDTAHGFPADATEVGTVTWDSTTTVAAGTNAAQCTLATTGLWTVTRGCPIPVRNQAERDALTPYPGMQVLRLDLGGVQTYQGTSWDVPFADYSRGAGGNIPRITFTKLAWTVQRTLAGGITYSSGDFTVPRAGRYAMEIGVMFGGSAGLSKVGAMISVNDNQIHYGYAPATSAGNWDARVTKTHRLASSDKVSFSAYHDATANIPTINDDAVTVCTITWLGP